MYDLVKSELIEDGEKFISLMGTHHVQCKGAAFTKNTKSEIVKLSVDGRVTIDAAYFRKVNPNCYRSKTYKVALGGPVGLLLM